MIKYFLIMILLVICEPVFAHEMSPTYLEFKPSYIDGVMQTTIELFNRREDVSYYEIQVFDKDWNNIPYASNAKIVNIKYLDKKSIDVFVRKSDIDKVLYVCTLSRFVKSDITKTNISSRICSKVK